MMSAIEQVTNLHGMIATYQSQTSMTFNTNELQNSNNNQRFFIMHRSLETAKTWCKISIFFQMNMQIITENQNNNVLFCLLSINKELQELSSC